MVPHMVPGSIHSHTVILVVVNYEVATAALGQTDGSMAAHSAPTAPITTTNIQQSFTFTRGTMNQMTGAGIELPTPRT